MPRPAIAPDRARPHRPDSLAPFLAAVARTPLLTAEEEIDLARRIKGGHLAGPRIADVAPLASTSDALEARDRLIRCNVRLAITIARRDCYRDRGLDLDDLITEGVLGLIRATRDYDPDAHAARFSTYAVHWIRQFIRRAIADKGRMIRVPVYAQAVRSRAARSRANDIGLRDEEILACLESTWRVDSLDSGMRDGYGEAWVDASYIHPVDRGPRPEDAITSREERETTSRPLREALNRLPERVRTIVVRRWGLEGHPPETFATIGARLGISRERVRQIAGRALRDLRRWLGEQG